MYKIKKMNHFILALILIMAGLLKRKADKYKVLAGKNYNDFRLMNRWLQIHQEGKTVDDCLKHKGCKKIAIYGMGLVGERLLDELRKTNILVSYGIDKLAHKLNGEIELYSLYDELPEVDAVIVTVPTDFDVIQIELKKKLDCIILSLEDILYEI